MKQKYFWFDLDGTLRKTKNGKKFINSPDNQEAFIGTQEAIKYIANTGFKIIGITNQDGCAAINPETLEPYKSIENAIVEQQVTLKLFPEMEKILFCPTYNLSYCYEVRRDSVVYLVGPIDDNSDKFIPCRKPGHGMVIVSVRDDKDTVDWDNSWLAGDRDEDQFCATGASINFIWASLFRSFFCSEIVEHPYQDMEMLQKFESSVFVDIQQYIEESFICKKDNLIHARI